MELMQLRMLLAAADGKSLQKAGRAVGRTPQAVGMGIAKLENELGVALFVSGVGKGLQLTKAGEVFANYARRSLSLLENGAAAVEEIRNGRSGSLRIGANQSIGENALPQITEVFRKRYPAVRLKVTIDYSDSVLASLARGDLDIALVANAPKGNMLRSLLLMTDRVVAVMSTRHPLALRQELRIEDLANESLILLSEASELHDRIVETFRRFQVSMNPCVVTSTLESIKRMAAQDMGIGIVPRLCAGQDSVPAGLSVKAIAEFGEDRELWMVHPQKTSPASQAFVSIVEGMYSRRSAALGSTSPAPGRRNVTSMRPPFVEPGPTVCRWSGR